MSVDTRRPPLPAPTDSVVDNNSVVAPNDLATEVSRMTDRTSYSLPEDGSPITIPTAKVEKAKAAAGKSAASQTSLLIEYFEGGKSTDRSTSRPSVRVKVTPSSKKNNAIQITEFGKDKKASYSTRVPLGTDRQATGGSEISVSDGSNNSRRPVEVEVLGGSEASQQAADQSRFVPVTSSVSSMPADSMLDGPVVFKSPEKTMYEEPGSRDLEVPAMDTLKAPSREKSDRSKSRERIAQKVISKLKEDPGEGSSKRRTQRVRGSEASREIAEDDYKGKSRRSSGSHRESGTDSSLRPREGDSNVSANSKSSLANNPKLLATVEDAIRRLILPEIEDLKRQQSVRDSRYTRDSMLTEDDYSRTEHGRRLSKSSSAPQMNPKVVLNRGIDDPGVTLSGDTVKHRRHRRSSQESSEKSSRRESYDTHEKSRDRERRHRSKDKDASRSKDIREEGLTTDALRRHERRSRDKEARERRKARSKSASQSDSIATTGEEYYDRSKIPPMPLNSDVQESDLTRDSIRSVETAETDRPATANTRTTEVAIRDLQSTYPAQGVQADVQTSRALKSESKSRSQEASPYLRNQRSDRSISSKGRSAGLAAAGLGGAAGALYGIEKSREGKAGRRSTSGSKPAPEDHGETRSIGEDNGPKIPPYGHGHYGERSPTPQPEVKATAFDPSSPEGKTRDLGISGTSRGFQTQGELEPEEKAAAHERGISFDTLPDTDPESAEDFYNEQHRLNNEYRKSAEYDSLHGSSTITDEANRSPSPIQESPVKMAGGQEIKNIGANPTVVYSPDAPESAVASLVEHSQLSSSRSLQSGDQRFGMYADSPNASGVVHQESPLRHMKDGSVDSDHSDNSRDRWAMLRENAKARSGSSKEQLGESTGRSVPASVSSVESLQMGASGLPDLDHPMPEIGHGLEQPSPGRSEQSVEEKHRSIIEGPLGDPYENRDHWPYEPTPPPKSKRYGMVTGPTDDDHIMNEAEASLMGAAVGLGIDNKSRNVSGGSRSIEQDNTAQIPPYGHGNYGERTPTPHDDLKSQSSASQEGLGQRDISGGSGRSRDISYSHAFPTPQNTKDEGYISANRADDITPLSFSKPPPTLFDESGVQKYDPNAVAEDPFVQRRNARYQSGNSHGKSPQLYDAATGSGRNHIESKDVVALMDHLTVRDGQRNARDTEILVTLVRSAAEMRESFNEMKKTMEMQGKASMEHAEKAHDRSVKRILNAPRPQVLGSSRTPSQMPSTDGEFGAPKKQNIFKRALRGLSSKNTNDLSRMEEVLNRLLIEVEDIRMQQSIHGSSVAPREDMTSYEQLRAAPDSGYEPEGNAGSSTPDRDHYSESPYSRRMHSGFVAPTDGKRISTVHEADEDAEELYANDDGMLTPTQEGQQQRGLSFNTPSKPTDNRNFEALPETPWSSGKQPARYKHRSSGSSSWVPRISRWSKTTSSSGNRTSSSTMQAGDRPYSADSHSGSDVNVLPPEGGLYERADDDRIRSAGSLDREIAGDGENIPEDAFDDPKYKANRHSLTLEHPQPRQGPTRRHQHHLESQAYSYGDARGPSPLSPNSDIFGSSAPLARWSSGSYPNNRMSASQAYDREGTPYGSEENYSGDEGNLNTAQAATYIPPRPPKVREDAPPIPAKEPLNSYHYSREPPAKGRQDLDSLDSEDDDEWETDPAIPLSRKQSPYSPGGLLAPIPERYSMEADRSSLGHRDSLRSRGGSVKREPMSANGNSIAEENEPAEEDVARALTPTLSPRAAMSGPAGQAGTAVRKLTGPREMPKSGGNGIRRKPIWGDGAMEDAYKL